MARSRNLKPGFFTNDLLAEVPPLGRLLFAGLWTLADREGRLEDRPKRIKAQLFPYDDCDVDALLEELANRRFIQRYEVDGSRLIQVTTWHRHQNPHIKEPESTLPAPGQHPAGPVPEAGENESSPSGESVPDRSGSYKHGTGTVLAPDPNQTRPDSAPDETGTSTGPVPVSHGSGPADSGFLIPDSLSPNPDFLIPDSPSPNPESAAERIPSSGAPTTYRELVRPKDDSDRHKTACAEDSGMRSLGAIAQRVELKLSPSEVAGYIMAHFPMQRRDRHQKASPGDSGLTLDQVHCLAKHGCTLQNARKAFEHFQQEPHPKNPGAWAFHCLREELSQDGRLDLREETRSAQRAFQERSERHLKGEAEPDGTGESRPAGAAWP
ncbi:MAG: hypothetical protein WBS54_16205 [Acidobacteriota bacterium]